jgi:hypothetical protein
MITNTSLIEKIFRAFDLRKLTTKSLEWIAAYLGISTWARSKNSLVFR